LRRVADLFSFSKLVAQPAVMAINTRRNNTLERWAEKFLAVVRRDIERFLISRSLV